MRIYGTEKASKILRKDKTAFTIQMGGSLNSKLASKLSSCEERTRFIIAQSKGKT